MRKQIKKWQFVGIGFAIMTPISTVMILLFSKAIYGFLGVLLGLILGLFLEHYYIIENNELSKQEIKTRKKRAIITFRVGLLVLIVVTVLYFLCNLINSFE